MTNEMKLITALYDFLEIDVEEEYAGNRFALARIRDHRAQVEKMESGE